MSKEKSGTLADKLKEVSPITWILVGVLAVMALLITFMTVAVSKITAKNALNNMETVAEERAKVIEDYVIWAEDTLTNFSHAGQVKEYLLNQDDEEAKKNAQQYTLDFAGDISDLEGLYIASWDSVTLTHNNPQTVGVVIRTDERLDELHQALGNAGTDVYNAGILISPNSGRQVVSIYKAIYDGSKPIGFVGLAVGTESLLSDLSAMFISGLENSEYLLVNAQDNIYLYADDKNMISTVCTLSEIQEVNAGVKSSSSSKTGAGEYKDLSNQKFIFTYNYLSDYGWTLFVSAPQKEVYGMRNQLQIFVLIFGALIILLVAIFGIINAHQEAVNRRLGNQLLKTEATEGALQTAMFKDILTDVYNRIAFSEAMDKVETDANHPCYFIMFDISELAVINTQFGNDAGDAVLCNTAKILEENFQGGTVYRTGDDEFVVAIKKEENTQEAYNEVFQLLNTAHQQLMQPQETPDGKINVAYKIAVVRSSSELSTMVVSVLKDIANRSGRTAIGQANFFDMDTL